MLKQKQAFLAFALVSLSLPAQSQSQDRACLEFGQSATLTGFILDGVFPGPPEFESVQTGDARYDAQFLYLESPVCVSGSAELEAEPLPFTELVQLACSETQVTAAMRGQSVTLTGTLFSQHTGYHRTPALLECTK